MNQVEDSLNRREAGDAGDGVSVLGRRLRRAYAVGVIDVGEDHLGAYVPALAASCIVDRRQGVESGTMTSTWRRMRSSTMALIIAKSACAFL